MDKPYQREIELLQKELECYKYVADNCKKQHSEQFQRYLTTTCLELRYAIETMEERQKIAVKELEDLPALQLKILETQASYVRPGGTLLYSTCTVLKRENEDVVSAFLAAHGEFTTEPLPLPDVFPKNETGMLTLIPGEYDTDGFFICRLRRKA